MINKTEIEKAQNSWGNGIITIGKLKDNPKESRIFTVNFINKHYDFDFGDVLFKPTKASKKQFRNNNKSALSYFIGSDNDYAEDKGFALNPWVMVEFKNVTNRPVFGTIVSNNSQSDSFGLEGIFLTSFLYL